jgi:putative ABC transport system permease protein
MNRISEAWRRLKFLLHGKQAEAELAEEMRLHMEMRAAERQQEGLSPRDAGDRARRDFGNELLLREAGKEVWGWGWLDSLLQDIRYGLRTLASSPGFTLTAVLSLALGIGANTAIFTILNAVMLRSLPVKDPQRLVEMRQGSFTNPIWEAYRDRQQIFDGMLAFSGSMFDLAEGGEKQPGSGLWVSGSFFDVLGVTPVQGRLINKDDDTRGGGKSGPVVVLSHAFWMSHYSGDPNVVGRMLKIDRHPFQIVGVAAPWFKGLDVDRGFDFAIPIACEPIINTDQSALDQRSWWWLRILGRLPEGKTIEQAEAQLKALTPQVNQATLPDKWEPEDQKKYLERSYTLHPASTGFSVVGDRYKKALYTLMAVVGLVLLIACANIANLQLARAASREREMSIRLAIGAGRGRVIRQLLTESLLLSLLGAAGGLLLARWGSSVLVGLLSTVREPLEIDLAPDLNVLLFTSSVAILTAFLFGLVPALRATGVAPNQVLKEHARGAGEGTSRLRLGKALVAVQVALSLVLLVGAGLFLGTMHNLLTLSTGFDTHNVLIVGVDGITRTPKPQRYELYRDLLERVRATPGVQAAASSMFTPISGMMWNNFTSPEGYTPKSKDDTMLWFNRVSPGYFHTMGTPIVAGRDFKDTDTAHSTKVIIINESAARKFFANSNPIGKTIGLEDGPGTPQQKYEVTAVAKDAKYESISEETKLTGYLVMAQDADPWPMLNIMVRTQGPVTSVIPALRSRLTQGNPSLSLEFKDFERQVRDSLLQQRIVALLSTFFAALALLLAVIGLYGITAYGVARRRGEIGIRMALGASQESVIRLVLRDVVRMLLIGTVLGVAVSLAAGRLVSSLLFGVKPADPATIVAAALLLGTATAMAGYLPARRASRLDPASALRDE